MADIITLLREESSQALLENGVAGVGALQTRELGYSEPAGEFSFKTAAGPFRHIPTREKLLLAAAAATSGAAGIGYFASGALTAVTLQDAIDELEALIGAGGGGTVLGTGTVGNIPQLTGTNTLGNSILSQLSSQLIFSGDAGVNLYRYAAGHMLTAATFEAIGNIISGDGFQSDYLEIGVRGTFYDELVVQGPAILQSTLATPIMTTAAATLTLGAGHHVVRTTHASPNITLPDSTTVSAGTEFYVFTYGNGCTFTGNGIDVWRGLNRDLGLGIEDDPDPTTYAASQKGFKLKTDGAGHWYIWEIA